MDLSEKRFEQDIESSLITKGGYEQFSYLNPDGHRIHKYHYDKEKGILFNAFRIETDGGITDKHLIAWQPACANTFHKPEFFVKL